MAVTMASAKKVRQQKNLKVFLSECSCRSGMICCAVARRSEMLFVYDELSYEELSAPIGGNVSQACAVRIMKLPLSARRNVCLKILMFIREGKKKESASADTKICPNDVLVRPHCASLLL